MMNSSNNEGFDFPIKRFEEMMNSNQVLYFDASEFENIIQYYMDFGRMGLAKKAIKMGLQQHPDSFKLQLMKADLLNFEDKSEEAFELLYKLSQIEPYNEDLYVMMANLFSKQDEHEKAIECLHKILKLSGDSTLEDVHYLLGMEHLMLENYQQAKEHFVKTLEIDGEDEVSLQNIVFCYEFLGKIDDAKDFLKGYIDKNPYAAIAWHQLGNIYQDEQNYTKALNCYDYAIIADDYFVGAIIEKAKVLEKNQEYKNAIEFFQLALTMEDPTSFVHYRIGKCYLKLNQTNQAISSFKKAVFEDPQFAQAWFELSEIYIFSDAEKSLKYISKARKIDASNLTYIRHYAVLCAQLGYLEEEEKAWNEFKQIRHSFDEESLEDVDNLIEIGDFNAALSLVNQEFDFAQLSFELFFRQKILHYILDLPNAVEGLESVFENEYFSAHSVEILLEFTVIDNLHIEYDKIQFLSNFFNEWL